MAYLRFDVYRQTEAVLKSVHQFMEGVLGSSDRQIAGIPVQHLRDLLRRDGLSGMVHEERGHDIPCALERAFHFRLRGDRKSTRLNSSHVAISYAVFCLKK